MKTMTGLLIKDYTEGSGYIEPNPYTVRCEWDENGRAYVPFFDIKQERYLVSLCGCKINGGDSGNIVLWPSLGILGTDDNYQFGLGEYLTDNNYQVIITDKLPEPHAICYLIGRVFYGNQWYAQSWCDDGFNDNGFSLKVPEVTKTFNIHDEAVDFTFHGKKLVKCNRNHCSNE